MNRYFGGPYNIPLLLEYMHVVETNEVIKHLVPELK